MKALFSFFIVAVAAVSFSCANTPAKPVEDNTVTNEAVITDDSSCCGESACCDKSAEEAAAAEQK